MVKKFENNQGGDDSLYFLYCILSEQVHNKYYFEWLNYANSVSKKTDDTGDIMRSFYLNILDISLKRFLVNYDKVKIRLEK